MTRLLYLIVLLSLVSECTAVRLGEQTPLATVKRWKSVPAFAKRSMLGVFT